MSNRPETEAIDPLPVDQKAEWESPLLRRVGNLGDVLLATSKGGLSEHDPGIESYKPHGQDPH